MRQNGAEMAIDISTSQTIAQAVRDTVPFRKNMSAREDLLARIGSDNADRQRALEERLSALESAQQSMQQAQKDMGAARKEAARQKIAQIKAKIQALQMMIGDNADSRARKIAQLARELAQAVRAYKAAGGTGGVAASAGGAAPAAASNTGAADEEETAAVQTSVLVAASLQPVMRTSESQAARQADKDFAEEARGLVRQLKNMRRDDRDDHGTNRFLGQALRGLAGLGLSAAVSPAAFAVDVTV